jgi:uncharacterized membrane protein
MTIQKNEAAKAKRRARWWFGALLVAISVMLMVVMFANPRERYAEDFAWIAIVLLFAGLSLQTSLRSEWQQVKESFGPLRNVGPVPIVTLITTVMVLFGFDDQPYGYYMLLRLCLCGASLFLLAGANLTLVDWQRWALGGFAVLYNPIVPIRIGEKDIWEVLNVVTVVLFWTIALRRDS